MLPALPTGRTWMSGASPSASTTSNAAVFWPSIRAGLTELTSSTGYASASLRATVRQSSKLPSTWMSVAPWATAWLSFPIAILPSGTRTAHVIPAFVAYAAALALVLPVLAQMTARAPWALATEIAVVIPRSLNDAVGLSPSYLTRTLAPVRSESSSHGMRGVPPSWSVTTGAPSSIGSRAAYSRMTPRHRCATVRLLPRASPTRRRRRRRARPARRRWRRGRRRSPGG